VPLDSERPAPGSAGAGWGRQTPDVNPIVERGPSLARLDTQPGELRGHGAAVGLGVHLVIYQKDLSVGADVEGGSRGDADPPSQDAIGLCDLLFRIAEDGVVQPKLLGKSTVLVRGVDACREVFDLKFSDGLAALKERLALNGSTASERLGKPSEHHCLASVKVAQPIRFSVGAKKVEGGSYVTLAQRGAGRACGHRHHHDR
jgi:hypothetical protein